MLVVGYSSFILIILYYANRKKSNEKKRIEAIVSHHIHNKGPTPLEDLCYKYYA